jgi:hypothetical protein
LKTFQTPDSGQVRGRNAFQSPFLSRLATETLFNRLVRVELGVETLFWPVPTPPDGHRNCPNPPRNAQKRGFEVKQRGGDDFGGRLDAGRRARAQDFTDNIDFYPLFFIIFIVVPLENYDGGHPAPARRALPNLLMRSKC